MWKSVASETAVCYSWNEEYKKIMWDYFRGDPSVGNSVDVNAGHFEWLLFIVTMQ